MEGKVWDIPIDVKNGVQSGQLIQIVTEDYGTNTFRIKILRNNNVPYDLTGKEVRLMVKTPSGARQQQNCTIENAVGGTVIITLKQSLILEEGAHVAELQIFNEGSSIIRLTTPNFRYYVRQSLQTDESVQASNEYTLLQEMLTKAEALIELFNEIATDVTSLKTNVLQYKTNPSTNANDFIETGLYRLPSAMTNLIKLDKMPTNNSTEGELKVFRWSAGYLIQRFTSIYGGTIEREYSNLVWTPWKQVATTEKIKITTFQNGWGIYDSQWFAKPTVKRVGNIVTLNGMSTVGVTALNTVICNIPAPFRPLLTEVMPTPFGEIRIDNAGNLVIGTGFNVATGAYFSLNGLGWEV